MNDEGRLCEETGKHRTNSESAQTKKDHIPDRLPSADRTYAALRTISGLDFMKETGLNEVL